jgi:hypothetical protein
MIKNIEMCARGGKLKHGHETLDVSDDKGDHRNDLY